MKAEVIHVLLALALAGVAVQAAAQPNAEPTDKVKELRQQFLEERAEALAQILEKRAELLRIGARLTALTDHAWVTHPEAAKLGYPDTVFVERFRAQPKWAPALSGGFGHRRFDWTHGSCYNGAQSSLGDVAKW